MTPPVAGEFHPRREERSRRTYLLLWFSVLGGIVSWSAHLGISWGLVPAVTDGGSRIWLHLTSLACGIIALGASAVGWSLWRNPGAFPESTNPFTLGTNRFMALIGGGLGALFLVLIVVESVGSFVLRTGS